MMMNRNHLSSSIQERIRQGEAYIAQRKAQGLPAAKAEARLAELRPSKATGYSRISG